MDRPILGHFLSVWLTVAPHMALQEKHLLDEDVFSEPQYEVLVFNLIYIRKQQECVPLLAGEITDAAWLCRKKTGSIVWTHLCHSPLDREHDVPTFPLHSLSPEVLRHRPSSSWAGDPRFLFIPTSFPERHQERLWDSANKVPAASAVVGWINPAFWGSLRAKATPAT